MTLLPLMFGSNIKQNSESALPQWFCNNLVGDWLEYGLLHFDAPPVPIVCVFVFNIYNPAVVSRGRASSQCVQGQAANGEGAGCQRTEIKKKLSLKVTTDWCKIQYKTFTYMTLTNLRVKRKHQFVNAACKLTVHVHKVGAANPTKSQSCDLMLSASIEEGQIIPKVQHLAMISGH